MNDGYQISPNTMRHSLQDAVAASDSVALEGLLHVISLEEQKRPRSTVSFNVRTPWYIDMQPELLSSAAISFAKKSNFEGAASIFYRMIDEVRRHHNGHAADIFDDVANRIDAVLAEGVHSEDLVTGFETAKEILISRKPGIATPSVAPVNHRKFIFA